MSSPKPLKDSGRVQASAFIHIKDFAFLTQNISRWVLSLFRHIHILLSKMFLIAELVLQRRKRYTAGIILFLLAISHPLMLSQGQDFPPSTEVINKSPLLVKALSWEPSVVSSGQGKTPHPTGSFWSDRRPSGLKFSANGLLGGCAAVTSISVSCVPSMAIKHPRPQPHPEETAAAAAAALKSGKYVFPALQESLCGA